MKSLLFIPIIAALILIPVFNSAYADHIDGYDDLFYYKEIDNTVGTCDSIMTYGGNGVGLASTIATTKYCSLFKVFNTIDVDGKEVSGFMGGSHTSSSPVYIRQWIYDGAYDATNSTQFPTDGFLTMGAGLLFTNAGAGNTYVDPYTPDLSASTESQVTNFILVVEDLGAGVANGYLGEFQVADLGTWTFSTEFANTSHSASGFNIWQIFQNVTGTDLDWGSVRSYNPTLLSAPTSLSAAAINDTSIRITWTDPVITGEQMPYVERIHFQVQNGTSDYYWISAGVTTNGTETFDWVSGEAGHTYNFRAVADAIGNFGAFSNEDSATTTGSSASTQTFRTSAIETYASSGIVDNSFYATETYSGTYYGNQIGFGNCDSVNTFDKQRGWYLGFTGTDYGQCIGHIKTFPTSLVDGLLWEIGDISSRTVDPVYYRFMVMDGDVEDVMDSALWQTYVYKPFQNTFYPDQITNLIPGGAGILYYEDYSGSYDDFTADFSSGTTSSVTMMNMIADFDATNGDNASSGIYWIKIGGLYNFYFPYFTGTGYEVENMIGSGVQGEGNWDKYRLSAFTPPKPITSASGVRDGVTADISYTIPSFDGGTDYQGIKVFRYCSDVDSDYTYQGMHRNNGATYTDEQFQQTWTGETYDVEPTYNYTFDAQEDWVDDVNIDVITGSGWIDYNILASSTSDLARPNPMTAFDDLQWTYEFDIYMDEIGEWTANEMIIAAQEGVSNNWGLHTMDGIGVSFLQGTGTHSVNAVWIVDRAMVREPFDFTPGETHDTLYFTVTRVDLTNFSVMIYSHESRVASSLIEQKDVVISGVTDTLSHIMIQNNYEWNTLEDDDEGVIYNMRIWSATTLEDIGRTPTYSETANGSCEYKLSSINKYGFGANSTAFTISLGADNAPTFSEIEPQSAKIDWNISGEAGVTGYGIQYSFDNITFINLIADTGNTATNYNIDGIDYGTLVYVQWTDIIGGVQQTWSSSGSFTTLTVQAGGGGPISSKTEIPPEDLTPEFIPPDPKKGLTALDLLQANVERIAPGQTKKAFLEIVWEGDSNLRINEVIVDESTGLKFAFQQPIEFPPSSTGKTTSKIPYTIEAPALLCTDQQTPKCVYNDATYEIPTNVFAESNNESIKFDSFLEIQVTDDFQFGMQEIFLGILGLVGAAVILGKHKGKNSRSKVMNRRPRPKTR